MKINPPKTLKEVKSFVGSVQYLAKYIPELATKLQPIRNLLKKKTTWDWTEGCQSAFEETKKAISDIRALKHYDTKANTILTTDASYQGLGATLWHTEIDGRRPVAFASRFLSNSEKNYATNELELLAIRWATEHFKYYLLGREFEVETDHKALIPIFNKDKLEKQYSSRLIRWRQRLLPFNFTVRYKPGRTMGITDYLSRNPQGPAPPDQWKEEETVVIGVISDLNKAKNENLCPEIEREIKKNFLIKGKFNLAKQKNAKRKQNLCERKVENKAMLPRDAIQLASSISEKANQPIREKSQRRVTNRKKENEQPANCLSLESDLISKQTERVNSISSRSCVDMANNNLNSSLPFAVYHRANTRAVPDGDTDSVVETTRADLLQEIKTTESELLYLKKKSHLVYMGGQWRPCKRKRDWDNEIVEELYDNLEQLREPTVAKAVPKRHSNAVLKYNWALLQTVGHQSDPTEPETEARWDMVKFIAAKTDIQYKKWLKEQNEDAEICLARQSVLASDKHALPPWLRKSFDDLNVKMGLLFCKQLLVPASLKEWVLQVLHGDHAGQTKMLELAKNLTWKSKKEDIEEKASNCLICFKAGKNLKPVIANNKVNRDIPKPDKPGLELQIDFAGPFIDEAGHKRFVLLAVDGFSRWPSAKLTKGCKAKDVLKFVEQFCLDNGQPKMIKSDLGPAFASKEFEKFCAARGIRNEFSTPYQHTPIGLVERHIQTFQK